MDMLTVRPRAEIEITASLYFWWLAFLRCSKDYWWICQQRGDCQDTRLVKVWEDFGDIFKYQCFMHWWQENGAKLFDSPQMEIEFIKRLGAGLELLLKSDLVVSRPGMICIAIPEYLDTSQAQMIIWEAWQLACVRGKHYELDAKYQLFNLCLRSKKTIIRSYKCLALSVGVEHSANNEPIHKWGDFEMGRYLNVSPKNRILKNDSTQKSAEKRNAVRNIFSQTMDSARELIANVEIGKFPCKDPVESCSRWSRSQQSALDHAVSQGQWHSNSWLEKEHDFLLPNESIFPGRPHDTSAEQIMQHIDGLKVSFLTPKRPAKQKAKVTATA
jgi:hypothetical protein